MAWSTPIIDRTLEDVEFAKANQNYTTTLKGAWNVSDINRVINNTKHLSDLLNANGYPNTIKSQGTFVVTDLPYVNSVMDVVRSNVQAVVNCYYKSGNPTIKYGNTFDYNDANALEINLDITNKLLTSMIDAYKYCGTTVCGETDVL